MTAFAEQFVAGKLNLGNSSGERNCNGHVIQQQRYCFELILAATKGSPQAETVNRTQPGNVSIGAGQHTAFTEDHTMKRIAGLLLVTALCAGCQAHMMETHGDHVQLLQIGQQKPGRGGVIRYLVTGPEAFQRARRADAEKQIRGFCSGAYAITAEGPRSKFGAAMPIGNKVSFEVDEYWYVAFECTPPSKQ